MKSLTILAALLIVVALALQVALTTTGEIHATTGDANGSRPASVPVIDLPVADGKAPAGRAHLSMTYRGQVVDATGAPIEAALVRIGEHALQTDAGGAFDIELVGGAAGLTVEKHGFQTLVLGAEQLQPDLGELVLVEQSGLLRGRVLDPQGLPVGGIEVSFGAFEADPAASVESCLTRAFRGPALATFVDGVVTSDADGRFSVPLDAASAGMTVWAVDATGASAGELIVERPAAEMYLLLQLQPVRQLVGRVLDSAGEPVAGATLRAVPFGDDLTEAPAFSSEWVRAVSDAEGAFRLTGVRPGPLSIGVEHGGGQLEIFRTSGSDAALELVLQGGRTLAGRLTDRESGAPVANGTVTLIVTALEGDQVVHTAAKSDAEGAFVLEHVPSAGVAHVIVRHADYAPSGTRMVGSTLGEIGETYVADLASPFDVQLEVGTTVTLLLEHTDGTPVPRATVRLKGHGGLVQAHARTDSAGRANVEHFLPGVYLAEVDAEGLALGSDATWIHVGEDELVQRLTLVRAGRVRGRLVDARGVPVAGGSVAVAVLQELGFDSAALHARADEHGLFEVRGVPTGGAFRLTATRGEALSGVLEAGLLPNESMLDVGDVLLVEAGRLEGRVHLLGGQGLPGATVHLVRPDRGNAMLAAGVTDADGAFLITGVEPGTVALIAHKPGHYATRLVRLDLQPGENATAISLELGLGTSITGTVMDRKNDGMSGVTVVANWSPVFEEEGGALGSMLLRKVLAFNRDAVLTDESGAFAIDGIPPDQPVQFSAYAEGYTAEPEEFSPFFVRPDRDIRIFMHRIRQ